MQGRQRRAPRVGWLGLLLATALGCEKAVPSPPETALPLPLATDYEAAATGTLSGRVTWEGPAPAVPLFLSAARPLAEPPRGPRRPWQNPNAPILSPQGGLGDTVVFLRRVDPARSRPWHHAPPRVELNGYRIRIRQGEQTSRFGFVPQGGPVEMVSTDEATYSLHVRGAAFFTLAFPDSFRPCVRLLRERGVVELSSGGGQFWMRAYLFVADHPYYAHTDSDGRFTLPLVPEGAYELVCWVPNWQAERRRARRGFGDDDAAFLPAAGRTGAKSDGAARPRPPR